MSDVVLEAVDLTKRYGRAIALDRLTLAVAVGEIVCLLGANGAGKSTTMNLFLGFTAPTFGEVKVTGRPVGEDVAAARRATGYVAEVVSLYPSLTGAENIAFFCALARVAMDEGRQLAVLRRLRFPHDALHWPARTYSKGMRQKIGLAIALLKDARAILLDEPLSGLDPAAANDLVAVLRQTAAEGVALLVSTHDIFRARDVATRIGIMRHGRLLEMVEPASLSGVELEQLYLTHMAERGMNPSRSIARKDWQEFVRDRRLVVMALLTMVLALAAIATSTARVARYEADRRAAESQDRRTWTGQGARNPHMAGHFGQWAFRPLTAGALLDPGAAPFAGTALWMEAHVRDTPLGRSVEDDDGGMVFGQFSAAWVLQVIAPLLLLVIAAGLVARERERGTLRLLLATGADAAAFVPGKLLGLVRVGTVLVAPVLLAAVLAAYALAPDAGGSLALLLWAGSYALFFASVLSIALCVSAAARSTSAAMLALLGLWFAALVLVPRAGATLAELAAPTPPASAFWSAVSVDSKRASEAAGVEGDRFTAAVLQRFHVRSIDQLPVSLIGLRLDAGEAVGDAVYARSFDRLAQIYARHHALLRWTGLLSPIVPLQNVSMALAGTDDAHQRSFTLQAEAHRERMMTALNGDFADHAGKAAFDYRAGAALWNRVQPPAFQPPSLPRTLASIRLDLLLLTGWAMVGAALVAIASRRLVRGTL